MIPEDRYLKFVRWSGGDAPCVGDCPDVFPCQVVSKVRPNPFVAFPVACSARFVDLPSRP